MIFFNTDRLVFRRFEPNDLDALAAISADPDVSRYIGDSNPLTREQTRIWIDNSRQNVKQHGYGTGAVVDRGSQLLIGWAGFARPDTGPEELIYGFDRAYWGQGFGTELLAGLITWAHNTLGLKSVHATVYPQNTASIAMLVHKGFKLVDSCYQGDSNTHFYSLHLM